MESFNSKEFVEAIIRAVNLNKPIVLDCIVDSDDKVWPMVAPGKPINEAVDEKDYNNKVSKYHNYIKLLKNLRSNKLRIKNQMSPPFLPPMNKKYKYSLVLDLDETLVHSAFTPFACPSDVIIQIEIDNEIHDIHVLVRPYVRQFLERILKYHQMAL